MSTGKKQERSMFIVIKLQAIVVCSCDNPIMYVKFILSKSPVFNIHNYVVRKMHEYICLIWPQAKSKHYLCSQ